MGYLKGEFVMTDLLEVLREQGFIEWFRRLDPEDVELNPKQKAIPPFVVWRYANRNDQLAKKLSDAVSSFQGSIEWIIDTSRDNWVLQTSRARDANERVKLRDTEPAYGVQANDEMSRLADHIHAYLKVREE